MSEIIFLFKDGSESCFMHSHLLDEMRKKNFTCIKLIDEDSENSQEIIQSLKGKNIVLITSDHFQMKYKDKSSLESFSVLEIVDLLKPIKKIYSFHDLGIHRIDDDLSDWNVMLPGINWQPMLEPFRILDREIVGWPKFWNVSFEKKYEAIFFVSLVYIYKERTAEHFMDQFGSIIRKKIPLKFPNYSGSQELIQKLKLAKIDFELCATDQDSFQILCQSENSITNSNSSIAIEASIAGCNSINLGVRYEPYEIYDSFQVKTATTSEEALMLFSCFKKQQEEFKFNPEKALQFIIGDI